MDCGQEHLYFDVSKMTQEEPDIAVQPMPQQVHRGKEVENELVELREVESKGVEFLMWILYNSY
jgi:hypothetical protein